MVSGEISATGVGSGSVIIFSTVSSSGIETTSWEGSSILLRNSSGSCLEVLFGVEKKGESY